jgi:uncharacterized repeat protein (TIGR01451 family)
MDYNATDSSYRFKIPPIGIGQELGYQILDSNVCNLTNIGGFVCLKVVLPNVPNCLTQSPGWDGVDLSVASRCVNNTPRFILRNNGAGMLNASQYRIFLNENLVYQASFQLASNGQMSVLLPPQTPQGNLRLVVAQSQNHPLATFAAAEVNCQTQSSTNGLFPPPDESPLEETFCDIIRAAYDPNDKLVYPRGVGSQGNIEPGTKLSYTIRFQNVGNDTAFNVVIVDTLSENLDISTFQPSTASHPYQLAVSGKGKPVLTWTFPNIKLVDSTTNEPGSHGLIQFSIRPKNGMALGTRLENFADIYFDFNDPIRTNTTVNTIWVPTLDPGVLDTVFVTEVKKVITERDLSIYPNPTKGKVNILTTSPATAYVFNSNGVLVIRRNLETSTNEIDLTSLSKGLYLIRLDAENGKQQTKIVLE